MIDVNRINNSTIAKLDRNEIGTLDLYNSGVYTYKGQLKSRKQGWKTVIVNSYQTDFVGEYTTLEFIKIVPLGDEPEYAMRVREKTGYMSSYPILWGCDFFK